MLQYDHCSIHNFALSNIIDCDDVLANSISIFDIFFLPFFSEEIPCPSSEGRFLFVLYFLVTVLCGVLLPATVKTSS